MRPPSFTVAWARRRCPVSSTGPARCSAHAPTATATARPVCPRLRADALVPAAVLVDGDIVIRTHEGAALTAHTRRADSAGVVVAYEADAIDPDTHVGWSVVATGYARLVTDPHELARYQALLRPWVQNTMDYAVRIRPDLLSGIRLTPATEGPTALPEGPTRPS
ncbi:pyridoxamine 5'-phosphate oxidase family protein [Streptomyces nigra]|uniref:pyridoxamine 5'-phosphate oxidase family protein n=1 Tax=Streptomyces nigra TaxID=1827580 RepID=UPI0036800E53